MEGTWERYSFQVGNILFLAMGDRNDGGPPVGRGERGGYPAGAVTRETFEWWREQVEQNQDKIIVTAHHHMLKETTVASGPWEGVDGGYHGRFEDGAPHRRIVSPFRREESRMREPSSPTWRRTRAPSTSGWEGIPTRTRTTHTAGGPTWSASGA